MEEIVGMRNITSKTFDLGGRKRRWVGSIGAKHYRDDIDDGAEPWKDIETAILPSPKPAWDYEVVKGIWHLLIKNDTTVAVGREGNWLGFSFKGFGYIDSVTKDYEILFTPQSVTPTVTNNKIRWENIVPGVNLEYIYENCRFKENIEITQAARTWLQNHPPSDYGLSNQDSYLGGYVKCDWQYSSSAEDEQGNRIDWENPHEFEGQRVNFKHPLKDEIITALPLGWAKHDDLQPNEWVPIRSRFFKKDGNHWLIFGAKVTSLNSMPAGTIILDPSTDEYPEADADCATLRIFPSESWQWKAGDGLQAGYYSAIGMKFGNGCRYVNIAIPKGSTINVGTHTTFRCRATYTYNLCNTRLEAEDVDNAVTFADSSAAFLARYGNITGQISWDDIPDWTIGNDYDTPEMQTVIAAIIETRAGWVSGNSIVIFWEDFENRSSSVDYCFRSAESFLSGVDPKLTIEYDSPVTAGGSSGLAAAALLLLG